MDCFISESIISKPSSLILMSKSACPITCVSCSYQCVPLDPTDDTSVAVAIAVAVTLLAIAAGALVIVIVVVIHWCRQKRDKLSE